jgi:hypothetical protein
MMNDLSKLFSMPNRENFGSKLMNPLTQAGIGMIEAHGRPTRQGGAFAGLGDRMQGAAQYSQQMEERKLQQEQQNKALQYLQANDPEAFEIATATGDPMQGFQFHMQKRNQKPEKRQIIQGADGFNYYTDTGERVLPGVEQSPDLTTKQKDYLYGKENPEFAESQMALEKAGGTTVTMNNGQATAAGFADRMVQAEKVLQQVEPAMVDMGETIKSNVPLAGNHLISPERQMAEQAQRDFINAILRRESGAVIGVDEFESARQQYFPQPGDSAEVIAQKRANRQTAIEGVSRAGGPGYEAGQVHDFNDYFSE